jgi:hypothetical protein
LFPENARPHSAAAKDTATRQLNLNFPIFLPHGPGSSVGIATGYELDGPGIEAQWARFSAPLQTGPGAHSASYTIGTGSFLG